jgi:hypothetical protein
MILCCGRFWFLESRSLSDAAGDKWNGSGIDVISSLSGFVAANRAGPSDRSSGGNWGHFSREFHKSAAPVPEVEDDSGLSS